MAAVAALNDPADRLTTGILRALREVRRNPGTAAWFSADVAGLAARMSRASEVSDALSRGFVSRLAPPTSRDREQQRRAAWLVRVIVSLLSSPEPSEAEERALIERAAELEEGETELRSVG